MAKAKSEVKKLTTVPNKLGFNTPTVGLALFIATVGVASSYIYNRYDNVFTRNVNSIRAGQSPVGA